MFCFFRADPCRNYSLHVTFVRIIVVQRWESVSAFVFIELDSDRLAVWMAEELVVMTTVLISNRLGSSINGLSVVDQRYIYSHPYASSASTPETLPHFQSRRNLHLQQKINNFFSAEHGSSSRRQVAWELGKRVWVGRVNRLRRRRPSD